MRFCEGLLRLLRVAAETRNQTGCSSLAATTFYPILFLPRIFWHFLSVASSIFDMEAPTIFYSWQSDTNRKFNQKVIERALTRSAENASKELGLKTGIIVDRDTKDVSGSPSIPETIFQKIDTCAAFLGDLTLVGQAWPHKADQQSETLQKFPNANVILELGYAAKSVGWRRIIGVMNTIGDKKPDDLIFHLLQRRWPFQYELNDNTQIEKAEERLVGYLTHAIATALREQHAAAERTLRQLNIECLQFLQFVKKMSYFSHDTGKAIEKENPEAAKLFAAIFGGATSRLLDLQVIFTDVDAKNNHYAYHWTYVGALVKDRV